MFKRIPFFNYPALFEHRRELYLERVTDVLQRGAFIMQKDLEDFENNLSKHTGATHAIGVADGTMALLMSLMAAGIGKEDEVIVPAHTFIASAAAIHHVGAKPVLVDCGPDHLIDITSTSEALTKKTKAIMPVQLNGRVVNMDPFLDLAKKEGLVIIEDSCQSLGASFKGKQAGTFGLAGTFSFFPAKTLGCFGDGGAIITSDDEMAQKIRIIRDHGRDPEDGKVKVFGFNGRLDNLHAAILDLKLKFYNEDVTRRREIASIYQEKLGDLKELDLPPAPNSQPEHFDVFQNYEIQANDRNDLRDFLANQGIETILQWGGYTINHFEQLGYQKDLPQTDKLAKRFIMLPMHPLLTNEEVHYISKNIINFYKYSKTN